MIPPVIDMAWGAERRESVVLADVRWYLDVRFEEIGAGDGERVVSYCGSGITACHNLLAIEHAGLGRGRL